LSGRTIAFACLAVAVAVSGVVLLGLDRQLTFYADDWVLLVKRQGSGLDYFLHPFHEQLVIGPAVVFKLLQSTFGMDSAMPFYVTSISLFLLSAVLLFVYVRRRVGDWLALAAAILILFLGAAFEDLFFAFQVGFFASVAAGMGMLIALDREDGWGDRVACALLVVSLAFSSLGIAFAAGALADLAFGRRSRAGRAYVGLLPLALYAAWWLGWGHDAQHHLSFDNVLGTPKFAFDSAAAGVTSLLGLATGDGSEPDQPNLIWGRILLIPILAGVVVKTARDREVSRGVAIALAIGLTFWITAGLDRVDYRFPTSSRYQYPSAVFLLLIGSELARGVRIPRPAYGVIALFVAAALTGGLQLMSREHSERWMPGTDYLRSSLAAVEIAGEAGDPRYTVTFPPSIQVPARTYLSAVREHGSPAFSEPQLVARADSERAYADSLMAMMLGISLEPPDSTKRTVECMNLRASGSGYTTVTLIRGSFTLANTGSDGVEVFLRRFAESLSVELGQIPPGDRRSLTIPADSSDRPWPLGLVGDSPVRLCTTGSA
jgi:hypothetical protein